MRKELQYDKLLHVNDPGSVLFIQSHWGCLGARPPEGRKIPQTTT